MNSMKTAQMMDVPSKQKKRLLVSLLWLNGQQNRIYLSLVDVPHQ
ncbi:hypothetical protein N9C12_07740 [Candidatus Poseidoniaceae archaeon]|nr:hypothetical protein [Candidatus Poseidoniaceae archaeon]